MDLKEILSISGKPGLYKVVTQSRGSLIVESLENGKKIPIYSAHKVSTLADISIYTLEEDIPLKTVIQNIYDKEDGKKTISHKSSGNELREYMFEVLPEFDDERVYDSDLKKLFQWYNLLHENGILVEVLAAEDEDSENETESADSKQED